MAARHDTAASTQGLRLAEPDKPAKRHAIYVLGEAGQTTAFYAGRRSDVGGRFHRHLRDAKNGNASPVAVRIREALARGGAVWCSVYADGLSEPEARAAEKALLGMLHDDGHPLANRIIGRPMTKAEANRRWYRRDLEKSRANSRERTRRWAARQRDGSMV